MDREIANVAAKAGLPQLRYVSFGNAPLRRQAAAAADEGEPRVIQLPKPEAEARVDRTGDAPVAAAPKPPAASRLRARLVEPAPAAAGRERPAFVLVSTSPAATPPAAAIETRRVAPPAPANVAGPPRAAVDFPLLRALEEQRRGLAGATAGGRGDGAEPSPPEGRAARHASPSRVALNLAS